MTRYFKTNQDYFNFINKYKDKYDDRFEIDIVKVLKTKVKVVYNIIK